MPTTRVEWRFWLVSLALFITAVVMHFETGSTGRLISDCLGILSIVGLSLGRAYSRFAKDPC